MDQIQNKNMNNIFILAVLKNFYNIAVFLYHYFVKHHKNIYEKFYKNEKSMVNDSDKIISNFVNTQHRTLAIASHNGSVKMIKFLQNVNERHQNLDVHISKNDDEEDDN